MLIGKKRPGSKKRARAAGQAAQAGGGQRPGKRRGRPAGSGRTAQAKAADLAQAVAGLESKRPVKKSRKAIEAEEALRSLHKQEAALSGSQQIQEAQPGQSLNEAHSTDQVRVNQRAQDVPMHEEPRHMKIMVLMHLQYALIVHDKPLHKIDSNRAGLIA